MAAFWDASAIAPLCAEQPATKDLRRLASADLSIVVWWGTSVEVRSALARLGREGVLGEAAVAQSTGRLASLQRRWGEVLPVDRVRHLAEEMPGQHGITAGDAFQLAAALVWCRERPRGRTFVCLDHRLAAVAARVGFSVAPA